MKTKQVPWHTGKKLCFDPDHDHVFFAHLSCSLPYFSAVFHIIKAHIHHSLELGLVSRLVIYGHLWSSMVHWAADRDLMEIADATLILLGIMLPQHFGQWLSHKKWLCLESLHVTLVVALLRSRNIANKTCLLSNDAASDGWRLMWYQSWTRHFQILYESCAHFASRG